MGGYEKCLYIILYCNTIYGEIRGMIRYEIWGGSICGDIRDVGTYVSGEIQNVVIYKMW